ncbi:MAG: hypothetical protein KDD35_07165, partial [Bdellovibrionales bacterium]|nr:hypothetical protein [Bdellovibrionales bacterium]
KSGLYHAAQSQKGQIRISERLNPYNWSGIFKHELSHQLWIERCGTSKNPMEDFLHEAFALWFSGDSQRIVNQSKQFSYISEARRYLLKMKNRSKITNHASAQQALSRLLVIKNKDRPWSLFFRSLIQECAHPHPHAIQFWQLIEKVDYQAAEPRIHYYLEDGISGYPLAKEGNPESSFPVGSILKPLTLALISKLKQGLTSRQDQTWSCPYPQIRSRHWEWPEALVKSCNGFFLDHQLSEKDYSQWIKFWKQLGVSHEGMSISQIIGLGGSLKLSLYQILSAYHWLEFNSPQIISTLQQTAVVGTLAHLPSSSWFAKNGIALKSGSVRSSRGVPINSWIVAMGPKIPSGEHSFRAIIHGEAMSTMELLTKLKNRLIHRPWPSSQTASVQILGLVPMAKIELSCQTGGPLLVRIPGEEWKLKSLPPTSLTAYQNQEIMCLFGPLSLSFPDRSGKPLTRPYFGRIKIGSLSDLPTAPRRPYPLDPRHTKARRGSPLIFTTSVQHYIEQVIASEFPRGHIETLKALAWGVRYNLHHSPHQLRPVCDTTHCQVFAYQSQLSSSLKNKVRKAVEEMMALQGPLQHEMENKLKLNDWFPFSLGGFKAWSKSLSTQKISAQLGLHSTPLVIDKTSPRQLSLKLKSGEAITLNCELFRNQLKLPSCPQSFTQTKADHWKFSGNGEGHGLGLSLIEADLRARSGLSFVQILEELSKDPTKLR